MKISMSREGNLLYVMRGKTVLACENLMTGYKSGNERYFHYLPQGETVELWRPYLQHSKSCPAKEHRETCTCGLEHAKRLVIQKIKVHKVTKRHITK